jgi:hypothetical protein
MTVGSPASVRQLFLPTLHAVRVEVARGSMPCRPSPTLPVFRERRHRSSTLAVQITRAGRLRRAPTLQRAS